jgi:glycosyltransferase involved in cell wall biosynthesis
VFVSCSKGESFAFSPAEAMTAGLPVILSDIPPHRDLVANKTQFLYPLGSTNELARAMAEASRDYQQYSAECLSLSRRFSPEAFLKDWERLFCPTVEQNEHSPVTFGECD